MQTTFGHNMYYWRRLPPEDRTRVLAERKAQHRPWHSLPHKTGGGRYMLTASCFEHAPVIGTSVQRMAGFEAAIVEMLDVCAANIHVWAVLPNHYHVLVSVDDVSTILANSARLHGRTAFAWNREDGSRGRQVWCGMAETQIKSDRHFWASVNYILNNPVKHGYAKKWTDWPFSNAAAYLEAVGRTRAEQIWRDHDISNMGDVWDP